MTFFDFLDSKFRASAVELQKGYKVSVDAEMKAGQWLIKQQHRMYRWLSVPRLIVDFLLIKIGFVLPPPKFEPPIYPDKKPAAGEPNAEVLPK